MLILPIGLSVVTDDPIGVGWGRAACVRWADLSANVVKEALEETLSQVHITDGVNGLSKSDWARKLTIAVAPVMLDALKMPLVHKDNDLLALALINLLEEVLVSLVDEDLLDLGEEDLRRGNVPVDKVLIKALLSECLGANLSDLLLVWVVLVSVEGLSVLNASPEVLRHVHASLVVEALGGHTVQFSAEELKLGAGLFSSLASILDLNAGEPELELAAEAVVPREGGPVESPSCEEDELTGAPVILDPLGALLVEVGVVAVEFLLWINILEELCLLPPSIIERSCLVLLI
jgi:hypothetical protein